MMSARRYAVVALLALSACASNATPLVACPASAPSWEGVWQCDGSRDPNKVTPCRHVACRVPVSP
jgi:hypothetical protein